MARESWTDERLDDLKGGMHREFESVHREFASVRREFASVHREFALVHREFDQVHAEIKEITRRLDSLQLTLIAGAFAIVAAIITAGIF